MKDKDIVLAKDILNSASKLVSNDRRKEYGDPKINFQRTADMISAYKGIEFTSEDVCMFMVLCKAGKRST